MMTKNKIFLNAVTSILALLFTAETSCAFITNSFPTKTSFSSSYHPKSIVSYKRGPSIFSSLTTNIAKVEVPSDDQRRFSLNIFSRVAAKYIPLPLIIAWCVQVCFNPENVLAVPGAIFVQFCLLGLLWTEVSSRRVVVERPSLKYEPIREELENHRAEKISNLRSQFWPAVSICSIACAIVQQQPGNSIKAAVKFGAPGMTSLALFASCWMALQTLDSCLDECAPAKPTMTKTAAAAVVFGLMARLTFLHTFFTIMATRVLIQCIAGKTIDKPLWIGLAIPFIGGLCLAVSKNWLPTLPLGVSGPVASVYFGLNVFCGSAYEKVQNTFPQKVKWVWRFKSLGELALVGTGLPLSWLIIGSFSIIYFWISQVTTDTVALKALGY